MQVRTGGRQDTWTTNTDICIDLDSFDLINKGGGVLCFVLIQGVWMICCRLCEREHAVCLTIKGDSDSVSGRGGVQICRVLVKICLRMSVCMRVC